MKTVFTALAVFLVVTVADAAEPQDTLSRLASCQESWLDMKNDPARARNFAEVIQANFVQDDRSPTWKPRQPMTWLGHPLIEITPQSVGMGLGFAVTVKARPETVRPAYEKLVGQPLGGCGKSDGSLMCEHQIAKQRTAMLVAPLKTPELGTMLGCYYFYQQ
jgi:hypothetical protein